MNVETYGGWKLFYGKKFTAFLRAYRTSIDLRNILDAIFRSTNYATPVFLREIRPGGFYYDYLKDKKIIRAYFDRNLKKVEEHEIPIHNEISNISNETEFFAMASLSEDAYRNYYITKYFRRYIPTKHINPFTAKIQGDNIEGLIMQHSYTDPFIEYVIKHGRNIIVTDKPISEVKIPEEPPEPFELHVIDETLYQRTMLFARVGNIEIMYPDDLHSLDETIKVPTTTAGVLRLIPVPAKKPDEIVERITKVVENPKKIYIHKNYTMILTDNEKYIIKHTTPPKIEKRV